MSYPVEVENTKQFYSQALPSSLAVTWDATFDAAITPNTHINTVWTRFIIWVLTDATYGLINLSSDTGVQAAIQSVADLYTFSLTNTVPPAIWEGTAATVGAVANTEAQTSPDGNSIAAAAMYAAMVPTAPSNVAGALGSVGDSILTVHQANELLVILPL